MKNSDLFRPILFSLLYMSLFTVSRIIFPASFQYLEHLVSLSISFVFAMLYLREKKSNAIEYLAISVALLICFNVLTTLSMNIDRSRSVEVLVLTQVAEKGNTNFKEVLEGYNITRSELAAYLQRFEEQSQMGLISGDLLKPKLSLAGRFFLRVSESLAEIWNLDGFRSFAKKD